MQTHCNPVFWCVHRSGRFVTNERRETRPFGRRCSSWSPRRTVPPSAGSSPCVSCVSTGSPQERLGSSTAFRALSSCALVICLGGLLAGDHVLILPTIAKPCRGGFRWKMVVEGVPTEKLGAMKDQDLVVFIHRYFSDTVLYHILSYQITL